MTKERSRPWRKYLLPLAVIAVLLTVTAGPTAASAATGGATTVASTEARKGSRIAFSPFRWAGATWYGPGFYGNSTACGQTLRPRTVGVAHRWLPCGTPVKFLYRGRRIVTRVIDRGPYTHGNAWDLTNGARRALGFTGTNNVRYAVSIRHVRSRARATSSR